MLFLSIHKKKKTQFFKGVKNINEQFIGEILYRRHINKHENTGHQTYIFTYTHTQHSHKVSFSPSDWQNYKK